MFEKYDLTLLLLVVRGVRRIGVLEDPHPDALRVF
jgi:hypothetical protein